MFINQFGCCYRRQQPVDSKGTFLLALGKWRLQKSGAIILLVFSTNEIYVCYHLELWKIYIMDKFHLLFLYQNTNDSCFFFLLTYGWSPYAAGYTYFQQSLFLLVLCMDLSYILSPFLFRMIFINVNKALVTLEYLDREDLFIVPLNVNGITDEDPGDRQL